MTTLTAPSAVDSLHTWDEGAITSLPRTAPEPAMHVARDVAEEARDFVHDQTLRAERYAGDQWDKAMRWMIANPFAALGIAFAAGAALSTLQRITARR